MLISHKKRWIALAGVLFLGLTYLFLILQNRVPLTHDTFQYLQLQYIYYNELIQHNSIPLWIPYQAHGVSGNYFLLPILNIFTPLLLLLGLLKTSINFLYLFYAQMFLQEILFLIGVILLGTIYFRSSKPIWFCALSLIGSIIWYPQLWWNFQIFYFLPLLLYSLHKAIDTQQPRFLFYSYLIGLLSIIGNPPQTSIFTLFVLFIYLTPILVIYRKNINALRKNIRIKHLLITLLLLLITATALFFIIYGRNNIDYYAQTRNSSGAVSILNFMTYGGNTDLSKYLFAFFRNPGNYQLDLSLYTGFLTWFFIIIALFFVRTPLSFIVLGTSILIILFSINSPVSWTFFYIFPFGKYFRHIGLTAVVAKLFIVFYAGFGVEKFFEKESFHKIKRFWPLSLLFIPIPGLLNQFLTSKEFFWHMTPMDQQLIQTLPVTIAILFLLSFLCLYFIPRRNQLNAFFLIIMILLAYDLWIYRYAYIITRMPIASSSLTNLLNPLSYPFKRQRELIVDAASNERSALLIPLFISSPKYGALYDTTETFLFTDNIASVFKCDYIEKSANEYSNAIMHLADPTAILSAASGLYSDKILLFSHINILKTDIDILKAISKPEIVKNMLLTTQDAITTLGPIIPPDLKRNISMNNITVYEDRITPININVKKFSFNELQLEIMLEEKPNSTVFLYYADAFNPFWQVFVDGKQQPVIKTNIGYKAVMVPERNSTVRFVFGTHIHWICISALLLLTILIGATIFRIFLKEFCSTQQK